MTVMIFEPPYYSALGWNEEEVGREISRRYEERKAARGELISRMERVCRVYNGDVAVYLPEFDQDELSAVPNLIGQGIDQYGMRVASVMPQLTYPSDRPGFGTHDIPADNRRRAMAAIWEMNALDVLNRYRARHLCAYGQTVVSQSPVTLDPGDKRKIPFWRLRNPMTSFPSQMVDHTGINPDDCIFSDSRPLRWLRDRFPAQYQNLYKGTRQPDMNELYTVLQYVDQYETVTVVCGKERSKTSTSMRYGIASSQVLIRTPNLAGVCPVVVGGRVTLDRVAGQFDQMLGTYLLRQKLMSLGAIAIMDNVFAEKWLIAPPGGPGSAVRVPADGRRGVMGEADGEITVLRVEGSQDAMNLMDRLDSSERVSGGLPLDFSGLSPSNIRTGVRGQNVLSETVDMRIQEDQRLLARCLEQENEIAARIQKAYYGDTKTSFFIPRSGEVVGVDTYVPNELFTLTYSRVEYPMAGTDVNALTVQLGQMLGMGMISLYEAMVMHPFVKDADLSLARITTEKLRSSLLSRVEQGGLDPHEIALIISKTLTGTELEVAVAEAHKEVQEAQAAQSQAMSQGDAGALQQPGLGAGPMGDGTPTPTPPPAGAQGPPPLEQLLAQLPSGPPKPNPSGPFLTSAVAPQGAVNKIGSKVPVGA